ncbi:cyclic nucleotide-binding domain-containing protein [Chitinophaga sedimenti]|uniref:cyclic nucleotide-binding domain-containing protein n=1 Tax=Chitinophaga sedimenti TaxID=2033606 RepID=UPI002002B6C5|nr:cyclic nucleotide-binding domain-containing protein [Chitinophaga sedimenti]MCK7553641.1 cyclic nucleotide-binding domain-containing protein [Chitinophaga sedimenti]
MTPVTSEHLQSLDALRNVPLDQLQWLTDNSEHYVVPQGQYTFKKGDALNKLVIIISGQVRMFMASDTQQREIAILEAGTITGYLPFSRATTAFANGMATEDAQLMALPIPQVREMICERFELTEALVHVMTDRVREYTSNQLHNEKMTALGKLSAGLAHELNNPASAVVRGAVSLKKHLQMVPEYFREVMNVQMRPEDVDFVRDMMFAIIKEHDNRPKLSMMERGDKEDEIYDWLSQFDVQNAQEIAENFVEFGFSLEHMAKFGEHIPEKDLSAILNWINKNLVTERMVTDIEEASQRISRLVQSVKTFTHMDQGNALQLSDVHDGINNTLTMLEYKLRKGNIKLVQEFDHTLPPIRGTHRGTEPGMDQPNRQCHRRHGSKWQRGTGNQNGKRPRLCKGTCDR